MIPVGSTESTLAPTETFASTPGEPSAFISTTAHEPRFRRQRSSCVDVDAQIFREAALAGTCVPA